LSHGTPISRATSASTVPTWPAPVELVEDVAARFAELVADLLGSVRGRSARLVASGGPTARRCYRALATRPVPWARVDILMGDERCVPPWHPDANQRLVREELVERVEPRPAFHPMSCERGPAAYEATLRSLLDTGPLDVVHLGFGADGHTASLFAGSAALEAPGSALVALARDPTGANPYERMTLTPHAIACARHVIFTVAGEEKRGALERLVAGEPCPARRLRAQSVRWLVERTAAPDALLEALPSRGER
jgi:6-phosphogluconolactonase